MDDLHCAGLEVAQGGQADGLGRPHAELARRAREDRSATGDQLQNDRESEVVVLRVGDEEQSLDTVRLLAFGKSGLATVKEEGESSFVDSARRGGSSRREGGDLTMSASLLRRSEMRAR
jgi:hypothetical protein